MTHRSIAVLVSLSVAVIAAGCGSREVPAQPPLSAYGPPDAGAVAPPAPAVQVVAVDAAAPDLSALVSGALAQGAAILGAMGAAAGSDPVDNGLKSMGAQAAPGMKPDGAAVKMTLAPGAHGEASVTLRPGKCYTIVAFGNLGVQTLAIRLVYPPPLAAQPVFEGVSNGPTATLGAKDQCVRSPGPVPTPLKLDVEMKQGQGQVGVQTYSR